MKMKHWCVKQERLLENIHPVAHPSQTGNTEVSTTCPVNWAVGRLEAAALIAGASRRLAGASSSPANFLLAN